MAQVRGRRHRKYWFCLRRMFPRFRNYYKRNKYNYLSLHLLHTSYSDLPTTNCCLLRKLELYKCIQYRFSE